MSPKEVDSWLAELATKQDAERKANPPPPRFITEFELERIEALSNCRFQPASFDKRFVRSMAAKKLGDPVTVKQLETLAKMFHRYRRQHGKA